MKKVKEVKKNLSGDLLAWCRKMVWIEVALPSNHIMQVHHLVQFLQSPLHEGVLHLLLLMLHPVKLSEVLSSRHLKLLQPFETLSTLHRHDQR